MSGTASTPHQLAPTPPPDGASPPHPGLVADPGALARSPLIHFAALVVAGVALGFWTAAPAWLGWAVAVLALAVAGFAHRLDRPGRRAAPGVHRARAIALAAAAVALVAAWARWRSGYASPHDIRAYLTDTPQLARVTAAVVGDPRTTAPDRGAFAAFGYQPPGTLAELKLESIITPGGPTPVTGRLLLHLSRDDARLTSGQRIEATGWFARFGPKLNPGDRDFAAAMADQSIHGRLTLRSRGNWRPLDPPGASPATGWDALRTAIRHRAARSLALGMLRPGTAPEPTGGYRPVAQPDDARALGLLDALLLGRYTPGAADLRDAFRSVGLAHILSISGAHLAILVALVWGLARALTDHPPRAAAVALVVLGLYLLAVPGRVPILRAGIMTGLFFAAMMLGRRASPVELLALAGAVILLWRPADLASPGFQLSFAAVLGLLVFTPGVARWLWPPPVIQPVHTPIALVAARWGVDFVAASGVAFLVTLPLVALHFGVVTPLAVLLSLLALPPLVAVLALGYLKIAVGLIAPSLGLVLAGPLRWATQSLIALVQEASTWPGAGWTLGQPVTGAWALGTLGVTAAVLGGAFAGRRRSLAAAVAIVALWGGLTQHPGAVHRALANAPAPPAAELHALAVGDGSCFVLRLGGWTGVFDCGSASDLDIGLDTVVPTLARLGVDRVDLLMVSHADLDHFSGVLDLADAAAITEVIVSRGVPEAAEADTSGTAAFFLRGLADRGVPVRTAGRGWRRVLPGPGGDAELELLWPTETFGADHANDLSLVLRVRTAGRTLLLSGDLQQDGIEGLEALGPLPEADAADLPHHGSFVEASPRWLDVVGPAVVIQSSGPARLRDDRWAETLAARPAVTRLVTARVGMVTLRIEADGRLRWSAFADPTAAGSANPPRRNPEPPGSGPNPAR